MQGYSQADIMAALQAQAASSSKNPPKTVVLADADAAALKTPEGKNARKLYCPREGCGCVIIGKGAAEWVEADAGILPTDPAAPFPPPSSTGYWLVSGGPYAFDNIGYSRPDESALPASAPGAASAPGKVKWLICAECDLGPLGWSFEGGQESWLSAERVKYSLE